jgi:hypothetical protein
MEMTDGEPRPQVMLGRPGADHLAIEVLGRLHPGADDYWDGNWLATPIEVQVGAFRATVGAALRADELQAFREDLRRVCDALGGEAVLASMEDWLSLHLELKPNGHVIVSGRVRDQPGSGNELTFEFGGLDQSDLVAILDALDEVGVFFPVVGSPG